jgi:hypothetical protein
MSIAEHIFLKTDAPHREAADVLAGALGMQVVENDEGVFVSAPAFGGVPVPVGGRVHPNVYSATDDPEDRAPYDGHPLVWDIWCVGCDDELQLELARAIFLEITHRLSWPAVLVHNLEVVLAAWDPERGLREYPPWTSVDVVDEPIWG